MTRFLDRVIGDEETVLGRAYLHWIYVLTGLMWGIGMSASGYFADSLLWTYFGAHIPNHRQEIFGLPFGSQYPWLAWMMTFLGTMIATLHIIKYYATEIALTDQRIIYKTGWLFVNVEEIDLAEVRAEHVHHGLLGRFLHYGELHLDSRFVGDIYLPAMRDPYKLLRKIHKARAKLRDPLDD